MKLSSLAVLAATAGSAAAEIYLKESFDDNWTSRWTESKKWKPAAEMGKWLHTAGKWYGDENDKGIQTSEDARFYGISAKLDKPFDSTAGKPLVIQYAVKHEQKLDCGGAYLKLLPGGDKFDAESFGGDAPYGVMFGPDICGPSNKKTHVILHSNTKNENLLIKKEVSTQTDQVSHLYTLVIKPDNTLEVYVDDKLVREGKLKDEFNFLEPEKIKDPDAKKPDDWVDEARIVDPDDVKPEGWDDISKEIPDPDASKPEDWDDEDDGEWEAPIIPNPEYKGEWKPKKIANPDYKGKWVHPEIDNPDFVDDETIYQVCKDPCTHVGFELWQVTSGTHFDDIIITDSLEEAQAYAKETFFKKKEIEEEMFAEVQKAKNAEDDGNDGPPPGMDMDDMDIEDMDGMDGMFDEF